MDVTTYPRRRAGMADQRGQGCQRDRCDNPETRRSPAKGSECQAATRAPAARTTPGRNACRTIPARRRHADRRRPGMRQECRTPTAPTRPRPKALQRRARASQDMSWWRSAAKSPRSFPPAGSATSTRKATVPHASNVAAKCKLRTRANGSSNQQDVLACPALSPNAEGEIALRAVGINRQHAPDHLVSSGQTRP